MIRWPVEKTVFIYTRTPGKCGITTITADPIVNSKLASEEGFDRTAFMLFSDIFTEYDLL
jgi:hypothetical protein